MRILHTESSCGWGGQEIRILEESQGLLSKGHQVAIACPIEAPIYAAATQRNIDVVGLPIAKKNIPALLSLRAWLTSNPVDLINTHSSIDSWIVALACRFLSASPAVVRTRHISAPIPNNIASKWLYKHSVSRIVTTGQSIRARLIDQFSIHPSHVVSVPTGIDPDRFFPGNKALARISLGLDPLARYFGIVATLRSWKGHLYLLDAFASLALDGWSLLLVGDGPMLETITTRIRELGLESKVILAGQQDNPEDWLRAMDVFVLPSYANEGVPQALLQAMFSGLPIVTTPVGAICEAVAHDETALIVGPKNSDALSNAMYALSMDGTLSARLGAAARSRAISYFTYDEMISKMETVFHQAINS